MSGPPRVHKVLAYITREGEAGLELLVFTQPMSSTDSGLQIPAGTVEPGEAIEAALYREVLEECGLQFSCGAVLLDRVIHADFDQERHYFHLSAAADTAGSWEHLGTGNGDDRDWLFCCRFATIEGLPELAAKQGERLALAIALATSY